MLYFPAPHSYTGEDVVELHGHGGRVVSDWLLARVLELGARAAEPGEFTLRAFLNDKLDLMQAEAVADLIAGGSQAAVRAAARSLDGEFSTRVAALQHELTRLRAEVEAWLDFPDEELEIDAVAERFGTRIDAIVATLETLAMGARQGAVLRDGLNVVIAGPPNAGKSSLLNRLAGYDAAIVTDLPGTTRDPLREQLTLDGMPVHVIDTAGVRESDDPIEREGVRRGERERSRADRVLWVLDALVPLEQGLASARRELGAAPFSLLRNKIDLTSEPAEIREVDGVRVVALSAKTGAGIDLLKGHLQDLAGFVPDAPGTFGARRRHLEALARARERLLAARIEIDAALEIAAEELRAAQAALSELTGEHTSDDLLGEIFATFCIGK